MRKYKSLSAFFAIAMQISGCFVGETAAIVVQTPFEVADTIIPGEAGEAVEATGEAAAWITDFLIPF